MKVPRSIVGRGRGGCRRVAVAAAAVAGLVSVSLAPADDAVAAVEPAAGGVAAASGGGGGYVSITPCRVVDTRKTSEGAMAKNAARTYQVAGSGSVFAAQGGNPGGCGIPADAAAVEVSITAVAPSSSGFFRAWPAGTSIPNATFLNYSKGQGITNTGTIPIGGSQMSMKNFGGTAHYVLDVQGYFTASGGTSPTALADVVAITAGDTHACALILGGTVRCWGENDHGQLGDGTQGNIRLTPVAVSGLADVTAIDAGIDYTCAVLTNGTAKCWGYNEWGAVGDGTQGTDRLTPVTVTGLSSIVSISAGGGHTCALIAGGTVKCWGLGVYGQVGDGTGLNRSSPVTVTGLSGVASVSAGGFHTCAALTNGTAMCWGDNDQGNLGDGTIGGEQYAPVAVTGLTGAASVSLGPLHACALLTNGTAKCWGNNDYGELGDGTQAVQPTPVSVTGLADVDSIALGSGHTCAVLTTAIAKCWGHNGSGQVGIGTFTYSEPTPVAVSGLSDVTSIEGGNNYTCARLANSTAKCWGTNGVGELGDGTQDKRTTPVPVIN